MKVKHIFIFSCYASYFLVLFLINHFEIDLGIDGGIILGLIGVVFILHALSVFLEWLRKNWERDVICFKRNKL